MFSAVSGDDEGGIADSAAVERGDERTIGGEKEIGE
jgi:hypothetical protein